MAAEYQVDVKLDASKAEQGAQRVGRALDGVASSADKAKGSVTSLGHQGSEALGELGEAAKTAFEFYAIKEVISELSHLSDSYTTIQNKLRSVSSDQANLNGLTDATYKIAQDTRTEWDEVANAYQRLGKATEHMGYSQRDVLDLTKTITQAMIVSGATAQEAAMSLMEITHGFEIGTLQGREFKVLLKDATPIIGELAKALHMSRAAFIEMGKHGKLTAELLGKAFKDAGPEIQAQFNKMAPTIGQTFTVIENAAKKFFGELMTDSGVLHVIADLTKFVVDHFDIFGKILVIVGETLGVYFGVKMIGLAIDGLRALGAAAMANPVGAFFLLLTAGIIAIRQFGDQMHTTTQVVGAAAGTFLTVGDYLRALWEYLKEVGEYIVGAFKTAWEALSSAFSDGLDTAGIHTSMDDALQSVLHFVVTAVNVFKHFLDILRVVFKDVPIIIFEAFTEALPGVVHALETIVNKTIDAVNGLKALANAPLVYQLEKQMGGIEEKKSDAVQAAIAAKNSGNTTEYAKQMGNVSGYHAQIMAMQEERDRLQGKAISFHLELDTKAVHDSGEAAKDDVLNVINQFNMDVDKDMKAINDKAQKMAQDRLKNARKSSVNGVGGAADPESPNEKAAKARAKLEAEYLAIVGQSNPIAEAEYKIAKAQGIVNKAVDAGIASIGEAEEVMDNFREKLKDQLDPFGAFIDAQLRERLALSLGTKEREQYLAVEAEEQKLRKQGLTIDDQKHSRIMRETASVQALRQAVAEKDKILQGIQAPSVEYNTSVRALDALLKEGKISLKEYAEGINKARDAYVATTPAAMSFENGVKEGLKAIAAQTLDVAGSVKNTMVNAFNGVNSALTDLIVKGKADWHSLVQSMEADVTQLILKMLELKLFQAVVPGGSLPGFATGGSFTVGGTGGTDTQLVAFRATPGERVIVQTPGQQGTGGGNQKGGTVVNLRSVNVTDPNQAIHAVDSRQGERVFTNFMRRNPGLLRGITGTRR